MMTCDYKDLTCTCCGGTIPKGDAFAGSFVRPRHKYQSDCQPKTATPKTTNKVYRRITENDPSIYGSQYLGREGEMAWMPR